MPSTARHVVRRTLHTTAARVEYERWCPVRIGRERHQASTRRYFKPCPPASSSPAFLFLRSPLLEGPRARPHVDNDASFPSTRITRSASGQFHRSRTCRLQIRQFWRSCQDKKSLFLCSSNPRKREIPSSEGLKPQIEASARATLFAHRLRIPVLACDTSHNHATNDSKFNLKDAHRPARWSPYPFQARGLRNLAKELPPLAISSRDPACRIIAWPIVCAEPLSPGYLQYTRHVRSA
jgi:hypothetical protein